MKFTTAQLLQFGADEGAWSIVTKNEREKRQITVVDNEGESSVAIEALGESRIPRDGKHPRSSGKKTKTPRTALAIIRRNGTEKRGTLKINFPKGSGRELRIYRNKREGFDYEEGDVWFIFRRGNALTVGSMPFHDWDRMTREDTHDDEFQNAILDAGAGETAMDEFYETAGGIRIKRNPATALEALERAGFSCEFDPDAKLFLSRYSGKPFVEAHHFIPLAASSKVNCKLDISENIVSLCPHWHRAIHHAGDSIVREMIALLAESEIRKKLLNSRKLKTSDLFDLYGV